MVDLRFKEVRKTVNDSCAQDNIDRKLLVESAVPQITTCKRPRCIKSNDFLESVSLTERKADKVSVGNAADDM